MDIDIYLPKQWQWLASPLVA
jgi:hypothetical protein